MNESTKWTLGTLLIGVLLLGTGIAIIAILLPYASKDIGGIAFCIFFLVAPGVAFLITPVAYVEYGKRNKTHKNKPSSLDVDSPRPPKPRKQFCDYCGTKTEPGHNCINCGAIKAAG